MIQLADDIDVSVAVSAIGLIKQLLRCVFARYTLLHPSYSLLIILPAHS
jgi:cohesin complex subunit SA-1/2